MTVSEIAFIAYPVSDLSRSTAFYRDTLELQPGALATPAWCEFEVGTSTFGIGTFEQIGTPGTARGLALEVPDMGAARAALQSRGVETSEPFETPVCFISGFSDPDGNTVYLHERKA